MIAAIGQKHGKSVVQVTLRWLVQHGIIVITKTTGKERMQENFAIFDFKLSAEEMEMIVGLDDKQSLFFEHRDPTMVKMLNEFKR